LDGFARAHGCVIYTRYDTEASKSLGFVNRLLAERHAPQCDVFWNNELLGTAALDSAGVLADLRGDRLKEGGAGSRWVSFAGRLRCVVSTRPIEASRDVHLMMDGVDLSRFAVAKPMFGTTLTQYCAWAAAWGLSSLIERQRAWLRRGLRMVDGNAQVKDLVAGGGCEFGFTDSDDYFAALDSGSPLFAQPVRIDGRTLCIPNTASVIAGTDREDLAQALVAHLGSPEVELDLAKSSSRQVPLGEVDPGSLPEEVRTLWKWSRDSMDVSSLRVIRSEVLDWLRQEYSA
jgi:iron(III) transport system substrate-binding protein